MSFRQNHPYLFWQLIGWGILLANFGFLVAAALCEFGEWSYPIIVFTFIMGLFVVAVSPILVRLKRRRLIPQNTDAYTEKLFTGKISELMNARHGVSSDVLVAVLFLVSMLGFMFAAFILGDRVSLALGFACMVLAIVTPFLIVGIHSRNVVRKFYAVENGEKRVEFTMPAELAELGQKNPRTLVLAGEPSAVLLNLFYNWLAYYLREENAERRLTLYKISAPELCRCYALADFLGYDDVLLCIPEEQLDLTEERLALFRRECDIMSALPFGEFARRSGDA
ncbi:MAG: hypothetical protein K2J77_02235 [Oscillospiraceae bacterium]|nr:hypothetical protein [Oscillospiraceae bacterium]